LHDGEANVGDAAAVGVVEGWKASIEVATQAR
jgi:hypothetical protein